MWRNPFWKEMGNSVELMTGATKKEKTRKYYCMRTFNALKIQSSTLIGDDGGAYEPLPGLVNV